MFTIGLLGQKGGTGKTTVAISLAVEIARAGQAVALIDIDPQANTANWKDRRAVDNPVVVSAQAARLRQTLDLACENGADFSVIDSPGHNDRAATETARCSDLVLIPSRPKVFDLETLSTVRDLLHVAGNPPAFVLLNGLHPASRNAAAAAKTMTQRVSGFQACPAHLSQRDIYGNAPATGQAAQELEPNGAAAAELKALYMWICKQVDMLGGQHGEEHPRRSAESA
jgi:chromosome partitioning protein